MEHYLTDLGGQADVAGGSCQGSCRMQLMA